ncbi:MAG: DUF5696 domain-containing protein [Clostridiales bacterium]|nr:DUF5696 domain-containing protein [Clostridiales bacterium]
MEKSYSVLPIIQGIVLDSDSAITREDINFSEEGCIYQGWPLMMSWFGQVKGEDGFIGISDTPWDAGINLYDDEGHLYPGQQLYPCLGRLAYRRVFHASFMKGDYNTLCKYYRLYEAEHGQLVTIREKEARLPHIEKLVGAAIVHEQTYWHCDPASHYYNKENTEANDRVYNSFDQHAANMRGLKEQWKLDKVYFHMDGWGVDGYDSHHPDTLPPAENAGGWEGMKRLSDTMKELGYIFATHDQYRDYYFKAETFDWEMAVRQPDGDVHTHSIWPGGWQAYLCATQAPLYVRRNYSALEAHGIRLEGTYQDVWASQPLDECDHDLHRMTRRECVEYRRNCMDYVSAHGIIPSSEEGMDCYIPSQVLCHWNRAPISFKSDNGARNVPLFSLVFHDCLLQPVFVTPREDGVDGLIEALLYGAPAYLPIKPQKEEVEKYKLCAELQERIARSEMLSHRFLPDGRQQTEFAGGIRVTVNPADNSYSIEQND